MLEKKSDFIIHPITVLQDNIVWVWVHNCNAVVVDPSVSGPVEEWLLEKKLSLKAILQTHHHDDHIGGTQKLINTWPCLLYTSPSPRDQRGSRMPSSA